MSSWKNSILNTSFQTDPHVILYNYINDNYNTFLNDPSKTEVTISTNFSDLSTLNAIIIEEMVRKAPLAGRTLGNGTKIVEDIFRIQVYAAGTDSADTARSLMQALDDMIDANPEGLNDKGISWMYLDEWVPLKQPSADQNLGSGYATSMSSTRFYTTCHLHYQMYR